MKVDIGNQLVLVNDIDKTCEIEDIDFNDSFYNITYKKSNKIYSYRQKMFFFSIDILK